MSLVSTSVTPLETDVTIIDGDEVKLHLYRDHEALFRVEIHRDRDDRDETWTFGVTDERTAQFRNSSAVTDLEADPEIPQWVEELLLASQIERVEA